jgi:allophanate hydrolase subunit 1
VPAGSVGIAGRQTGVYPLIAPGGWQLIGATPLLPVGVDQPMPFMFRPGQSVRFEPIDAATYDTLRGTARV